MRYSLIIIFTLFIAVSTSAQKDDQRREKLESQKIAFISDRLDLSPQVAQVFWPVYNQYDNELKALRSKKEALHKEEEINEDKANMLLKQSIEYEENLLEIKKSYIDRFTEAIGPIKTLHFFRMERRFKQKLLRSFKERKEKRSWRNK